MTGRIAARAWWTGVLSLLTALGASVYGDVTRRSLWHDRLVAVEHGIWTGLNHIELDGSRVGPWGATDARMGSGGGVVVLRSDPDGGGLLTLVAGTGEAVECALPGGEPTVAPPDELSLERRPFPWRGDGRAAVIETSRSFVLVDVDAGCSTLSGPAGWVAGSLTWAAGDVLLRAGTVVGHRPNLQLVPAMHGVGGFWRETPLGDDADLVTPFVATEGGIVDLAPVQRADPGLRVQERVGGACAEVVRGWSCFGREPNSRPPLRWEVAEDAIDAVNHGCGLADAFPVVSADCWRYTDGRRFEHEGVAVDVALSAMDPGWVDLERGVVASWPGSNPDFSAWERDGVLALGVDRFDGRTVVTPEGLVLEDRIFD